MNDGCIWQSFTLLTPCLCSYPGLHALLLMLHTGMHDLCAMTKSEAMQQLNHSGLPHDDMHPWTAYGLIFTLQLTTSTSSVSEDGYISPTLREVAGGQASIRGLEVVQTNLATYRRHPRFLECPVQSIYIYKLACIATFNSSPIWVRNMHDKPGSVLELTDISNIDTRFNPC